MKKKIKKKPKLNQFERDRLESLLDVGTEQKEIAKILGRNKSTISREISRNLVNGKYVAKKAQHKSKVRRKYAKYQGKKINENKDLESYIIKGLAGCWNPDEISGRMEQEKKPFYASKTAIYDWLYSARGQRYCYLLPSRQYRRKERNKNKKEREMIPNRVGIELRPREFEYEFGHLEHDTFVSGRKTGSRTAISVMHEPKAAFVSLTKIPNLKPDSNEEAIQKMLEDIKNTKSITRDNGLENKYHEKTSVPSFFCEPYSAWQKPHVEQVIKTLRRFFKKGSDLNQYSQAEISFVQALLNNKPRKILGYKTPFEVMMENDMLNLENLNCWEIVLADNNNRSLVAIRG